MKKCTLRQIKQKDGTFIIPGATTHLALADKSMGGRDGLGVVGSKRLAFALKEGWMVNRGDDGTPIVSLDISQNNIGPTGAQKLFEALPGGRAGSLTELDVSANQLGPEEGSKALNFALRKDGCGTKLIKLVLSRNNIRDEGMLLLTNTIKQNALPALQRLTLTRNLIEDEGATLLAQALSQLPALNTLYLNANQIGDAGAKAIADAPNKPATLQHLLLTDNKVGDAGASALAVALKKEFPNLEELALGKNFISGAGCAELCAVLVSGGGKKLKTLTLDGNEAIAPTQIENLNECLNLPNEKRSAFKPVSAQAPSTADADSGDPSSFPGFFRVLEEAEREGWTSEVTLQGLAPQVSEVSQLKLFYTAASAAVKLGDISKQMRNDVIAQLLQAVIAQDKLCIGSDQAKTTAKLIVDKAVADGIISSEAATQLNATVSKNTEASEFLNLAQQLSKLDMRVDSAGAYAQGVDEALHGFKEQYKEHVEKHTPISTVSAILGVYVLGLGTIIASASTATTKDEDTVLNKIVDFTDTQHILNAMEDTELTNYFEKFVDWIDQPLDESLKDKHVAPEFVHLAAIVKTSVLFDPLDDDDDNDTAAVTAPVGVPPQALTKTSAPAGAAGDHDAPFLEIKKLLGLGDDVAEVPVDDDFCDAFQMAFKLNFADIDPKAEDTCRKLVDVRSRGKIKLLQWRLFFDAFAASNLTMSEYIKTKL